MNLAEVGTNIHTQVIDSVTAAFKVLGVERLHTYMQYN